MTDFQIDYLLIPALACASAIALGLLLFLFVFGSYSRRGTMLILSRKVGEEIMIGDNVRVMVTKILGDSVRIGIAAPPEVPVNRREVLQRGTDGEK